MFLIHSQKIIFIVVKDTNAPEIYSVFVGLLLQRVSCFFAWVIYVKEESQKIICVVN